MKRLLAILVILSFSACAFAQSSIFSPPVEWIDDSVTLQKRPRQITVPDGILIDTGGSTMRMNLVSATGNQTSITSDALAPVNFYPITGDVIGTFTSVDATTSGYLRAFDFAILQGTE